MHIPWKKWLAVALTIAVASAEGPAQTAPPNGELAIVRGRCVAAENGQPLAGCKVEFDGWPSNDEEISKHGKPDWKDPEPVVTGADGRFEFRFVPPPPYQHHLDASCDGRVPRTARWGAFRPGQVEDLGDVPMAIGYVLQGVVVDQKGKPVPRLSVGVHDLPLPCNAGGANDIRYGTTKDDGTFRVSVPLPPGTWPLRISGDGCALVSPQAVTVVAQADPNTVTIRVERMPSISGVVFDDRGHPVKGVYLQARPGGADGWMTSAYSRKDGSFTIYKRNGSPDEVHLEIDDPGPCEGTTIEGTYQWETHGLRLELRRALSFELTVVAAGTGTPVETYSVICYREDHAGNSRFSDMRLGDQPHPEGKVTVDRVWRGQNVLRVVPRDGGVFAVSDWIRFEAKGDELPPQRVELTRLQPIDLVLLDAEGKPLTGGDAWLVDDTSKGHWNLGDGLFDDPRGNRRVMSSDPVPLPIAQSHATVAADGKVRLHHAPPRGKLALVVQRERSFAVVEGFSPAAVQDGRVVVR